MVPSCAEGGVLGVLPGIIGVMQAIEAVKLVIGVGDTLIGRLVLFDALKMKFRELKVRKDPNCPICSANATIKELIDYDQFCGVGPVGVKEESFGVPEITVEELKAAFDAKKDFDILDVREPQEFEISQIEGSKLIPMGQLASRIHELDSAREIYILCKSGIRSAKSWKLLHDSGFRRIKNVAEGIDAWSERIDPTLPRY